MGRQQLPDQGRQHGVGLGIDVDVVQRPQVKGFQPIPKRWVIERTFGWLIQHRRLARDYEALPLRDWTMTNKMTENSRESRHHPGGSNGHPARNSVNINQMPL